MEKKAFFWGGGGENGDFAAFPENSASVFGE